jgi:hypothetical protein
MTPVELGAVDRVVRDVVAGAATARLGVDALPMPREERVLLLFYRDQSQRVLESEVVQPADRVREEAAVRPASARRTVARRQLRVQITITLAQNAWPPSLKGCRAAAVPCAD